MLFIFKILQTVNQLLSQKTPLDKMSPYKNLLFKVIFQFLTPIAPLNYLVINPQIIPLYVLNIYQ